MFYKTSVKLDWNGKTRTALEENENLMVKLQEDIRITNLITFFPTQILELVI